MSVTLTAKIFPAFTASPILTMKSPIQLSAFSSSTSSEKNLIFFSANIFNFVLEPKRADEYERRLTQKYDVHSLFTRVEDSEEKELQANWFVQFPRTHSVNEHHRDQCIATKVTTDG